MRILVACEFSGAVRRALRQRGVTAYSNDLVASEDGGEHILGDCLQYLGDGWDGLIAHPDCTHHVVSGARWFHETPARPTLGVFYQADHYAARERDRAFVLRLWQAPIPRIAIENPVGTLGDVLGPPTQIVQPWWFGDRAIKTTCFWLKGFAPLKPTNQIPPPADPVERRKWQECWNEAPGPERRKNRSRTYPGLAAAIAEQWGADSLEQAA